MKCNYESVRTSAAGSASELLCFLPNAAAFSEIGESQRETFRAAQPFPHLVIDDLFPPAVLDSVVDEIPPRDASNWRVWGSGSRLREDSAEGIKMGISNESLLGPITRNFLLQLNSAIFLRFLNNLLGLPIPTLMPDPSLFGGGLHATGRNGRLLVHTDIERHPLGQPLCQRVNVILYLNRDWAEDYGGHLELWSRDSKTCVKRILPVFNRMVIFESGSDTYHGHPVPLSCPPDRYRYSLALYYYQLNRPISADYIGYQKKVGWINDTADAPAR